MDEARRRRIGMIAFVIAVAAVAVAIIMRIPKVASALGLG
jgi:hypothetical protein